ncbi:MAG: MATE family efflux transporter [Bacteroidota bacterium]
MLFIMRNIWKDIVESIRGTEQDFTTGSIGRAIFLLSIPMVLEMLMESVFAIVDIFFVSRLGAGAIAIVGITETLMTIIYALGIGLSMATTALVARRIGEKDKKGAAESAVQAILVGLILSTLLAIPAAMLSKEILALMKTEPEVIEAGSAYTTIMLACNGVIMLLFIINAVFRSAGDAAISMRVLFLANIINIILDPCLIFGLGPFPELGIKGAAIATTIGRGIAVLYQFYLLFDGKHRIQLAYRHIVIKSQVMFKLLRLSIGGVGQFLIATTSWIFLMWIMATFGKEAQAGYTIAIRIFVFTLLPSWGMSNAASTMVGQNLGAKQPNRAERSVWISAFTNMIFLMLVGIVFLSIPGILVSIFSSETEVLTVGVLCLKTLSYGFIFYALGMVMSQAFNGAGDTTTPTILNFICFYIIEVPLAYILAIKAGMQEMGVFLAITIAESLLGILSMIIFRQGRWKLREV